MSQGWQRVVEDLRAGCVLAGLDLVQPFQVACYNRAVDEAFGLPDLGRPSSLGVLIGNTRALWPRFVDALRARPHALHEADPLDRYVDAAVVHALQPLAHRWEVRWAHEAPPRRVAMQRLAQVSGLAHLSPSHLSVHAVHGPWIALRAAVVIDIDGPEEPPPEPPNPCRDCEIDCLPRFRRAVELATADSPGSPESHAAVQRHWQAWLAVRDACPVGRAHRYDDQQIRYHYAKDRDVIERVAVEDQVTLDS